MCSQSSEPSPYSLGTQRTSELGGIYVLISVACGGTYHATVEETDEVWIRMIELNLSVSFDGSNSHLQRSAKVPRSVMTH
jgi:hypothetical protein